MKTAKLINDIERFIWHTKCQQKPLFIRFCIKTLRISHAVLCDLRDGQLSLRAMSLVYTTIISLVPLLALCFSVLKGFGAHNEIRPMLLGILEPLGEKSAEISERIIGFVDNIQVGVLGAVGLALLIYSVVSMMQKIERAFNYTWHVSRGRSFAQRFSDYLSVLLVGPLFIFLSTGITTTLRTGSAIEWLETMPYMGEVIAVIGLVIPYLIMAFAFGFIYFYMPNTRVRFSSAFVGGLVTAIIWKLMGWVVASFVAGSAQHTAVYSAFAALIVFMIWLYLGWFVLLIGASVAYYHQKNPKSLLVRQDHLDLSSRVKEKLGLNIVYLIGKSFYNNDMRWSREQLATALDVPEIAVADVIHHLEDKGLIVKIDDTSRSYYPAQSPENISLSMIMNAIRAAESKSPLQAEMVKGPKMVERSFSLMEKAINKELDKVTLKDLVLHTK